MQPDSPRDPPGSADPPAPGPLPATPSQRFVSRLEARGTYRRWVLAAALAGMFANTFPFTILAVALGRIAEELGVEETTIAWVISAPLLVSAIALPLLGKLGDLHGHRRIFLLGSALALLTAAATTFAWSALSLIALRTLAALVGGATQPSSMALIFSVYGPGRRTWALGWWSMVGAGSPALGLIAGGPLVDALGWRAVFLVQAVFGLLALLLAWLVLRETPTQRVRFDVAGSLTLAIGVGGFLIALGRVRSLGLADPAIWGAVAIGVVGLLAFVRVEDRAAEPLLPLELFARRNFTAPMLASACMGAAYMGAFVMAPLVLLELFAFSVTAAAATMALRTLTLSLSSPLGGHLGTKIGERRASLLGNALMTLSQLVLLAGVLGRSVVVVGAGLVLQGLGQGLCLPSLTSAVANAVPQENLGVAMGASRLVAQVGTAFGITLVTMVYGGSNTAGAFALAFLSAALLSGLAVLFTALMAPTSDPA